MKIMKISYFKIYKEYLIDFFTPLFEYFDRRTPSY